MGKALPEGITAIDIEDYGQRDGQSNRLGVNIPVVGWSTPFSFYNTRVEVLTIAPVFTHIDGATINRVDNYSEGVLFGLAHDFGHGWSGGLFAGPRTSDNFNNVARGVAADIRASAVYDAHDWQAIVTFMYAGNFGGKTANTGYGIARYNDYVDLDYTLIRKFGKFQLGFVGYAQEDITGPIPIKPGSIGVGGLAGYQFDKLTLQVFATREVAIRAGGYGLGPTYVYGGANGGLETRGYVRLTVPLYVAPQASPPQPIKASY